MLTLTEQDIRDYKRFFKSYGRKEFDRHVNAYLMSDEYIKNDNDRLEVMAYGHYSHLTDAFNDFMGYED